MTDSLKDNSKTLRPVTKFFRLYDRQNPFKLGNGKLLKEVDVAYQSYGNLNSDGTNAILICHALTGNSHAAGIVTDDEIRLSENSGLLFTYNKMFVNKPGWWDNLIGPDKTFDTNKYFVICSNILGSCYGTTGPGSLNPDTGQKYNMSFPEVSVRDLVNLQKELLKYLGVKKVVTVTGGSLGGMQALEWAVMYPDMVQSIIPIATAAAHSPWAIGFNDASRSAIINDPEWNNGDYTHQPLAGLSLARKIAMLSYRSFGSFLDKFGREVEDAPDTGTDPKFLVETYLDYQGEKLVNRFDANTYLYITKALDNHDLGRDRGSMDEVLGGIRIPVLCIGIDSDILYPVQEQKDIASKIPNGEYAEIKSIHGHDAFLIEFEQMDYLISRFLSRL